MTRKKNFLIGSVLPVSLYAFPVIMLAVYIVASIMPASLDSPIGFGGFCFMIGLPYLFSLIVLSLEFLSKRRSTSFRLFFQKVKPSILRGFTILIGIFLIYGSIRLSLCSAFDEGAMNLLRLFFMIGGPIIIGMFTLFAFSSIEENI